MNVYNKRKINRRILILMIVSLAFLFFIEIRFRPIIKSIALTQVHNVYMNIINKAILSELSGNENYSNLLIIDKNSDQEVISVNTDVVKLNSLRSKIFEFIEENVSSNNFIKIKVPIGTLTGLEILNGRGPNVVLKTYVDGCTSSDFISDFSEAGINQTKYRLYINISMDMHIVVLGMTVSENIKNSIPISETIIIGKVPTLLANSSVNNK